MLRAAITSVASVATRNTGEGGLVGSVLIVDRSTRGAPLTGVFGVDERHRDAGTSGLVGDECLQRPERPVSKPSALGTAGLDPFANALAVFKAGAATGALRRQQWFSCLWTLRCFPELAKFGGLEAATQSGPAPRHSPAHRLDLLARVLPAITIGRGVDDTSVAQRRQSPAEVFYEWLHRNRLVLDGVSRFSDPKARITKPMHKVHGVGCFRH
jgi:hypothetical protein